MARIYPSFEDRFHSRYRKVGSCWLTIKPGATGYGSVEKDGKTLGMHRASWLIHKGSLPETPLCVLHKCDNRACCNPKHLYLGTKKDNRRDFMQRNLKAKEIVDKGVKARAAGAKRFWDSMTPIQRKKFCNRRRRQQLEKNGNTHPVWGTPMKRKLK